MTIEVNYNPIRQQGNGVIKDFSYDFYALSDQYLVVYIEEDGVQTVTTDYTATVSETGGIVTFNVAPTENQYVVITRSTTINQEVPYTTSRGFDAKVVESSFDKDIAISQELQNQLIRAPKLPEGYNYNIQLPNPDDGKALVWNGNQGVIRNSDYTLNESMAKAAASAKLSKDWAEKTTGIVSGDFSSKAYAIGGKGTEKNNAKYYASQASNSADIAYANAQSALNSKNKAQEWAISKNIVDSIDYSSKYYANKSQKSAELSAQYANDKINQTHITNCITEISQDIKLELNNGTLTLKAGSTYYKCDGSFTKVTTSQDYSKTNVSNGYRLVFFTGNGFDIPLIQDCNSGTSEPTTGKKWFNTSNYILYSGGSGNWQQKTNYSLPLAIITVSDGTITSIDQVFNGFGYIGSTVFALPGVKGLIPNGRNNDGTLKNIEFTTKKVLTLTGSGSNKGVGIYLKSNELQFYGRSYKTFKSLSDVPTNFSGIGFIIDDNLLYTFDSGVSKNHQAYCVGGVYDWTDNKISSFIPKTVFHASDFNDVALKQDLATIPHIVETYVNGTSWYRVYSDGWCEQGANNQTSDTNGGYTVTFLKPFKNTNYNVTGMTVDCAGGTQCVKYTAKSATSIGFWTPNNTTYSSMQFNWQACGYIS